MHPTPQPAKAITALRRITNKQVAAHVGVSEHYTGRVLNGYEPASAKFRAAVSELLGLPEEALFRPRQRQGAA